MGGQCAVGVFPCSQGRAQGRGLCESSALLYQTATPVTCSVALWSLSLIRCEQSCKPKGPAGGKGDSLPFPPSPHEGMEECPFSVQILSSSKATCGSEQSTFFSA